MPLPIVHHPAYVADTPSDHRFPMAKFGAVARRVEALGLVGPDGFHVPEEASPVRLSLAHDEAYIHAINSLTLDPKAVRRLGLPLNETVARRARLATGGTILTGRLALEHGVACNTAGGSHHANASGGAGFCVFNDVAVAARVLLAEGRVRRILVVDLDVHQGDGTALIMADDDRVFTFSMHCEANWPLQKPPSDRDVQIAAGTGDQAYLEILAQELPVLFDASRPDLVFYNAGVDPHADDRLGKLKLSDEGLAVRDTMVFEACKARGVPAAGVLGGGYSMDIDALARRHGFMFEAAARLA
jgi:acetoin utilization deacetylase AcuC-like enzyme